VTRVATVFLKRIVLNGFKSFADRTEFEFGSGITAIVGPNGCGKSNILDAVRWVLGEQSARCLRGDRMADVIFAGSRSRKPANYAEVRLVFDNRTGVLRSDQPEVIVARTLYRDGHSEYRLNGELCRLKDIRELLLDTGLGVDAYSVIEQGRVDLLLQANPLERREIFEEAAGISRYKFRRQEAQRKLERAQNNLLRLQDITDELEKRLRSVRLAAGKARNFQEYDRRLRELRSSFCLAEYHQLQQSRRQLQRELDRLEASLQELRSRMAGCDAEQVELEQARQSLDERIAAADSDLLSVQSELSALGERIAQGESRLAELVGRRTGLDRQAAELTERAVTIQQRLAAEEQTLRELADGEQQIVARIAELQTQRQNAEQSTSEARRALESQRLAAFQAARQSALLQNQQENLSQQSNRLSAHAQRLAERQAAIAREEQELAQASARLARRGEEIDQQLAELAGGLREKEAQLAALRQQVEELDQQINDTKQSRSAVLSQLALLEDMERRLEGVDEGTRAVLTWREANPSQKLVVGLLAELLHIEPERVAILQPVLSGVEQHVVVRDTAGLLAELARRGMPAGALRVLGLDRLTGPTLPIDYSHTPGFVARAAAWVTCQPDLRPLVEHLLGRVFIVQTVEQALRLAAEALAGCVFVSLDGVTVGTDGRLTFGSPGPAAGLISRKAEIRQLSARRDDLEAELVRLGRRQREAQQCQSDALLLRDALLERIAVLQREHAELRSEQARLEDARQRLEREQALIRQESDAIGRSLAEIAGQLQSLSAQSEAVAQSQAAHEARVAELAGLVEQHEAEVTRLSEICTRALIERGQVAEKRAAAEQSISNLRGGIEELNQQVAQVRGEAERAARQMEEVERQLNEARQRYSSQSLAADQARRAVLELRQQRQELLARLEQCGGAGRELQQKLQELESVWHGRQVEMREAELRAENLAGRAAEELGLDLAQRYAGYEHRDQDWEAVRAEIEELRGKIARLGNVNLDAIAELEELSPRYEHLMAQRNDLVEAIRRLESMIAELDSMSRARFGEALEQIRGHFQEMFRRLFGGGRADIVLEDPENPLECGIEIVARPPGKEPQSISLLSGGEKTLTAVALLLGVFRSRPSPFAILDEVDAALDESNIERFNSVLQEFLSHSQFVVITHSKRTMAAADVLHGVTMEEPGVSKRVSVRFEDRVQAPIVA